MSNEPTSKINIDELIFADKNKEYGAYKLRKAYKQYLSIAMWIAIFIVILATTGPATILIRSSSVSNAPWPRENTKSWRAFSPVPAGCP